jgi:quinol monooxygenase YgiN
MVILWIHIQVRPSRRVDAIELFDSISGPVSVQPGCLRVGVYAEINNDDDMVLIEEWQSQKDLERHLNSHDFQKILAVMDLADVKPDLRFLKVSSERGLALLESIRRKKDQKQRR